MRTHWHHDPVTLEPAQVSGDTGDCCSGYATYQEVFG